MSGIDETPSRPRVDQSYSHELPSLPTMRPVDSDGEEEYTDEMSESDPNLDLSYSYSIPTGTPSTQSGINSSSTVTPSTFPTPHGYARSSLASSGAATPSSVASTRDTPLARYAMKNPYAQETPRQAPSTPLSNGNTPFSSTPASYQSARSRTSIGSANRSLRSSLNSTASPRSRFSRPSPRRQASPLRDRSLASKYDLSGISAATPSMASESMSSIRQEDSFMDEQSLPLSSREDQLNDHSLLEDQAQLIGIQEEGNSFASFSRTAEVTDGRTNRSSNDDTRNQEVAEGVEATDASIDLENQTHNDGEGESKFDEVTEGEQHGNATEEEDSAIEGQSSNTSFDTSMGLNSKCRLPSAELSLVLEAEEEEEEEESKQAGSTKSLVDAPTPDVVARTSYVQLGLRRSRSAAPRPELLSSPMSSATSATSESRVSTPNGASQNSQQLDVNLISIPFQSDGDISEDSLTGEPRSMLSDVYHSPLKDATNISFSTRAETDYRTSPETGTPYRRPLIKEFTIPIADLTPAATSKIPRPALDTPRIMMATPLPSSNADRRTSLVLSTLSSSITRPKVRGTPHTRRSFVGSGSLRNSTLALNASRAMSETPTSSTHMLSLPGNSTGLEEDSSFVSVESAEDLTNLHRANTSLPVSENPSRQIGVKLHKHLHELNTQQHVLISSLQDENEDLRDQLEAAQAMLASAQMKNNLESNDESGRSETSMAPVSLEELDELKQLLYEKDEEIKRLHQRKEEADQRDAEVDEELAILRQQIELLSQQELSQAAAVALPPSIPSSPEPSPSIRTHASLENLLSAKTAEVESIRVELAEVKATAERHIQDFGRKTEHLESEIMDILVENEAELKLAQSEKNDLKDALVKAKEENQKTIEFLEEEINSVRAEKDVELKKLVDMQAHLDSTLETVTEKDQIIVSLRTAALNTSSDGRVMQLELELSAAQDKCIQLGEEVRQLQAQVSQSSTQLKSSEEFFESITGKLMAAESRLATVQEDATRIEEELSTNKKRLQEAEEKITTLVDQLAQQQRNAAERGQDHQGELLSLGDKLAAAVALQEQQSAKQTELESSHSEALSQLKTTYSELITSLEDAVAKADTQADSYVQQISSLQAQVSELEDQTTSRARTIPLPPSSPGPSADDSKIYASGIETSFITGDEVVSQLKAQLFDANKELSRMKADMASSPYRRAALDHKNLRIQVLESLNTNLDSHLGAMRNQYRKLSIGSFRSANSSIANNSIMSVQTPRNIGSLRKMPWLDSPSPASTFKEAFEIERLQSELDHLNELIDLNVAKLKDSGKQQLSLSDELSSTKDQLTKAQSEFESEKKKAEGLLWENEQLQLQTQNLLSKQSSDSVLSIQITSLQATVSRTKEELLAVEQSRDADRQSFKSKHQALQKNLNGLEAGLERKERALKEAINARRLLEENLAEQQIGSQKLEQDIKKIKNQRREESESLAAAEAARLKLESEVKRLERDVNVAHSDLEHATQHAEHLTGIIGRKDASPVDLITAEKEKASLRNDIRRLNQELSNARLDLEDSQQDANLVRKTLESKQSIMASEIERLEKTRIELDTKVRHSTKHVADAEREISDLKQTLNNARVEGTISAQQVTQDLQNLRRQKTLQDEKLRDAEIALSEVENQCIVLKAQLTASKATTSTLQETLTQQQSVLASQTQDLAQYRLQSQQIEAERETVKREIVSLEKELQRAKRDTRCLKDEISSLRSEQSASSRAEKDVSGKTNEEMAGKLRLAESKLKSLEASQKNLEQRYTSVDSELRVTKSDLSNLTAYRLQADEEARRLDSDLRTALTDLSNLKYRHSKESKGLLVDIRYLKQKFTRENSFREDLSLQKEYLLILIGQLSRQQSRVYAAISQMGCPDEKPVIRKRRTLKSTVHAVILIIRTRNFATQWRKESEVKVALMHAYERVVSERAARTAIGTGPSKPLR